MIMVKKRSHRKGCLFLFTGNHLLVKNSLNISYLYTRFLLSSLFREGIILLKDRLNFLDNKGLNRVILVYMAAGVLLVSLFIGAVLLIGEDRILKGTFISSIDVGGMKREQAKRILIENFEEVLKNKTITISYQDRVWKIKSTDTGACLDVEKAVKDAYGIEKNTSFIDKVLIKAGLKKVVNKIPLDILFSDESIFNIMKSIRKGVFKEPVDAIIVLEKGRFVVTEDIPGVDVDKDELNRLIKDTFRVENPESVVNVPVITVKAQRTYEMLKAINTKISVYRTLFRGSSNRINNIKIGTSAVDGEVIMPGEVFSLNKTLGPRIAKYGYLEAPVIVNGEIVEGLGGGVCQVATTLYNAALLADLDILERKNHGLPLNYVSLGRDATISGDYLDLKLRNNRKYPVYIRGYIYGSGVYFEIHGDNTTPDMRVEIVTDVVEIITPKAPKVIVDYGLPEGYEKVKTRPRIGYRVKSYRKTYINNELVRSEQLGDDHYKSVTGEIIVGKSPR